MKKYLPISIASILAVTVPNIANAQLYVTAAIGGVPSVSGATLEKFDAPSPSILTLSGSANLVTGWPYLFGGGAPFNSAPPLCSGSTLAYFGEPSTSFNGTSGFDGSQYVAVAIGGSATLSLPGPENYLGLLWGTPDPTDTLTFYDLANNVIGTVTGANIPGLPAVSDPFHTDSTFYVNITSTTPFSRVVLTSNTDSFEFDDAAYALVIPEPASSVLLGCGLCLLGLGLRQKFMKSAGTR
jgi:hypothetical protein